LSVVTLSKVVNATDLRCGAGIVVQQRIPAATQNPDDRWHDDAPSQAFAAHERLR
jgi:hypothetical protein